MRSPGQRLFLVTFIIWMVILASTVFAFALRSSSDLISVSVMPEVPRLGDPVSVSLKLNNPGPGFLPVSYELFVNDERVKAGSAVLDPLSTAAYTFNYISETELGGQTIILVKAGSGQGDYVKTVTVPGYAPQIWSSFVSFASFSTSVMGSMSSMVYYQDSFTQNQGVQVGFVFAVVLLALLIFRDVTVPIPIPIPVPGRASGSLALLRVKFGVIATVLLIVFLGMIFTRVVMILT